MHWACKFVLVPLRPRLHPNHFRIISFFLKMTVIKTVHKRLNRTQRCFDTTALEHNAKKGILE